MDPKAFAQSVIAQLPEDIFNCASNLILDKLDLVPRAEFDIQCRVLQRIQQRLVDIELQLDNILNSTNN